LPYGSILDVHEDFYVCSPELMFVQMANHWDTPHLIALGIELCGIYTSVDEDLCRCPPLTSAAKLSGYVSRAQGIFGREKAQKSLKYVADNSASPRESILTMLLCLPYRLGGYGIEMPVLNQRIILNKAGKKIASKNFCACDLYWPKAKLAVEYDSDAFHVGPERISNDSARRTALAATGVSTITITNRQLFNIQQFNEIAHQIASITGKRLQYKEPMFSRTRLNLRESLFKYERCL